MGDWADRAFELLRDREGDEHLRIQRELQIRDQTIRYAPDLWMELRTKLNSEIKDFTEMRPQYLKIHDSYDVVTLRSPKREVEIRFSQEHPQVTYTVDEQVNPSKETRTAYGTFSFVVKDQKVWFQLEAGRGTGDFDKTSVPLSVDEVGEFLLDRLI